MWPTRWGCRISTDSAPQKLKVIIEDLAYCGGCETAIADVGEALIKLLAEDIELQYAPILMSKRDYGNVDLGLVIGAVRSEHDLKLLKRARERSRVLVAFGSCASLGGIPSLANLSSKEELLDAAYKDAPSISNQQAAQPPSRRIPFLLDDVRPVDSYVNVDFKIPGCPPPPPLIAEVVSTLVGMYKQKEEARA
jgi:F420-non-reducing hydrogenase small subunit